MDRRKDDLRTMILIVLDVLRYELCSKCLLEYWGCDLQTLRRFLSILDMLDCEICLNKREGLRFTDVNTAIRSPLPFYRYSGYFVKKLP